MVPGERNWLVRVCLESKVVFWKAMMGREVSGRGDIFIVWAGLGHNAVVINAQPEQGAGPMM